MWERIARNWKTSSVALIAATAIVMTWFGVEASAAELATVIAGFEALVLIFAKD